MVVIAQPPRGKLAKFRKTARTKEMRQKLSRAVNLIRGRELAPLPVKGCEAEFLFAAWTLAAQDPAFKTLLERDAANYVLGYALKKHSADYDWNGQYWAFMVYTARQLFGVKFVSFVNPGKVDKDGKPVEHSHEQFAAVAARLGRGHAELEIGYDLTLTDDASFEAAARLDRLLEESLGYGVLPEVSQHFEQRDAAYDLVENDYNDTYMMSKSGPSADKTVLLEVDGVTFRTAFWTEQDVQEPEAVPFDAKKRAAQVRQARNQAKRFTFMAQVARARPGDRLYKLHRSAAQYKDEHRNAPKQKAVHNPVAAHVTIQETLSTEHAFFAGMRFPKSAYTPRPDLSPRDWRQDLPTPHFAKRQAKPEAETLQAYLPPELGTRPSTPVWVIANQLHAGVYGESFEDALTSLIVTHSIFENDAIRELRVKVKTARARARLHKRQGPQFLQQLCTLAAHIIFDRDDATRRDTLEQDEAEVTDLSSVDTGSLPEFLAGWLKEEGYTKMLVEEVGQLPFEQAREQLERDYGVTLSKVPKAYEQVCEQLERDYGVTPSRKPMLAQSGVEEVCREAAAVLVERERGSLLSTTRKPRFVDDLAAEEVFDMYALALKTEQDLRDLEKSRQELLSVQAIGLSPDHERLEQLAAESTALPPGTIGLLANARVRHHAVCATLQGVERAPEKARVAQVQLAVDSYRRKAPKGLVGWLAKERLAAQGPVN